MMDLGYRTSVRHIRTADGTAKYYVPDGLESFGHVNSRSPQSIHVSSSVCARSMNPQYYG